MSDPLSLNTIYSRLWQAFSSHPAPEVEFTRAGRCIPALPSPILPQRLSPSPALSWHNSQVIPRRSGSTGASLLTGLIIACIL